MEGQRLQFDQQRAHAEDQRKMTEAQLNAQTQNAKIQADTELRWRMAQLSSLTALEVALIGSKTNNDSQQISARLEAALQMSDQEHEKNMAGMQIAADQQAQVSDQAAQSDGVAAQAPVKAKKPSRDEQLTQVLASIADAMRGMAVAQNSPKRIVRGPDGRVSHVEPILN
jgi:hypothetical protein